MKVCRGCGVEKPLDSYYHSGGKPTARCRGCHAEAGREYRRKHPERVREAKKKYRMGKGKKSEAHRRQRYGISAEEMERMCEAQGGGCAICGAHISAHNGCATHVDHDHSTGRVRGILCRLCNPALGAFRDDPSLLRKAADYLEGHVASTAGLPNA